MTQASGLHVNVSMKWFSVFLSFQLVLVTFQAHSGLLCVNSVAKPEERIDDLLGKGHVQQLTLQLQIEFQKIDSDKTLSRQEKNEKSFATYLKLRFNFLTPDQKAQIELLLLERFRYKVVKLAPDELWHIGNNQYGSKERIVDVEVPEHYAMSVIDFSTRAHEIEHAIQALVAEWQHYPTWHPKTFPVFKFSQEKGAMLAEGAYLLSVPKAELQQTLLRVRADKNLTPPTQKHLIQSLEFALTASDAESYVQMHWNVNRYSKKELKQQQFWATFSNAFPFVAIPGFCALYYFLK